MKSHQERIRAAQNAREINDPHTRTGVFRQRYHFMPSSGWMNDPNGLIYWQGQYHLFYQHNPYSARWGSMYWGHAVSADMVHWRHLPIALAPSEPYDDDPGGGCFSGSAVDDNGKLALIYTAAAHDEDGTLQTQCLAWSNDGIRFEKNPANPVISGPPEGGSRDFRDPKVWRHGDYWYLIAGTCKGGRGKVVLYRSKNLINWEYLNAAAENTGRTPEEAGEMWECPDLFPLGDRHLLIFSPVGADRRKAVYLAGSMDYEKGIFEYSASGDVDYGFDYYAPQTFTDEQGQRVIIGWASDWNNYGPVQKEGWCGHFALPRRIENAADNRLRFIPVEELRSLRVMPEMYEAFVLPEGERKKLTSGDGISAELLIRLDLSRTSAARVILDLRAGTLEYTRITIDFRSSELVFDRSHSAPQAEGIRRCRIETEGKGEYLLHIFLDTCSIEIFADDYKTVLTGNIYSEAESNSVYIESLGGIACFAGIETYGLSCTGNENGGSL